MKDAVRLWTSACAGMTAALVAATATAAPFTVFNDDFEADAAGGSVLDATAFNANKFTRTQGSVDIVRSGDFQIVCAGGSTGCIDLDGSTSSSQTPTSRFESASIQFQPGFSYTLSFDLSGNQRNGSTRTVEVSIPGLLSSQAVALVGGAPFGTYTFGPFDVASLTAASIVFLSPEASNNIGLILDNVVVTATEVPIPGAAALLLAGLGGLAFAQRRRTT